MLDEEENNDEMLEGQMSFLDHFDEFRKRVVKSILVIGLAFIFCFYFSDNIYNFLSVPVRKALTEAQRRDIPLEGKTGTEKVLSLKNLKEGDEGRYVFDRATSIGITVVSPGTSVKSVVTKDVNNKVGLFTTEDIYTSNAVIPKGIRLPIDLSLENLSDDSARERMVVTTATEPFTLLLTVSLYSSIVLALPFLLLQIWGFISPALYNHEKKYVTPFILLSTISFVIGCAFAYYILFPPAVKYLLGLGSEFQLLLNASDYLDFILLIMVAMGGIFQMPAIAYVLSRIGIISAGMLIRSWKIALVVMLIAAAFVSPTGDIPNLMLFATPMFGLYIVSIFVAWMFGKKRETDLE